jgi:hypothetical protein
MRAILATRRPVRSLRETKTLQLRGFRMGRTEHYANRQELDAVVEGPALEL